MYGTHTRNMHTHDTQVYMGTSDEYLYLVLCVCAVYIIIYARPGNNELSRAYIHTHERGPARSDEE